MMAPFYLTLNECGTITADEDGHQFADLAAAHSHAIHAARSIMAAEVLDGCLCISCSISIGDENRVRQGTVMFKDAVAITGQ